ncbi:DUF3604 domain-containing protein [Vallitalea maricola]|uniref:Uncharacterized protein n=1 Tax=Vallitalea maricola TaxID=3074433 RepID=A0ACB5UPM8_9FIRM|nr:hypothetical protein AN2V17_36680 [Vallitalea sp. AN17-2]
MKEHILNTEVGTLVVNICDEIVVNGELEWELLFKAKQNIEKGGSIKILVPAYQHQRSEEYLQTYDYWKPNYIYAVGEEDDIKVDVRIEKIPSAFSHITGWVDSNRIAVVALDNGLKEGQTIKIKFGGVDRPWLEGECTPSRVSQFSFRVNGTYLIYKVFIDKMGNGEYQEIKAFPLVRVVPDKARKIVLTAPSIIKTDEGFNININVIDRFNNPIFDYDTDNFKLVISNLDTKEKTIITKVDDIFSGKVSREGFYEIIAEGTDLHAEKAVLLCDNSADNLYWGDIHTHSNLTANIRDNDCGAYPSEGYLYAKEVSRLDYICISEQTFMFNEDRSVNVDKETWNKIGTESDRFYEKGSLVTFPGIELHSKRGDTVVLFRDSLSSYEYPSEDVLDIGDMWKFYKEKEFLSIPHLHRYCNGRPRKDEQEQKFTGFNTQNWKEDNEHEVLCEIYSSQWGRFENDKHPMILKARANVEGNTVVDFLNSGKKWGTAANSDGHDGNPGYGGITGVYASEKTRESIFESLSSRKTLASTHPRTVIKLDINGYDMGSINEGDKSPRDINIKTIAPSNIKKVEVIRNGEVFCSESCTSNYMDITVTDREELDKDTYYYIRVVLENGHLGWTSPIWFI